MLNKIFAILLGSCLLINAYSASIDNDVNLDVSTNQKSFVINLAANPTTGFQWSVVKFDKNLFTLSNSQYLKSNTKLIGAGGQMRYTFNLNQGQQYPSKTQVLFKYARSWEPKTGVLKRVNVHFK